MRRCRCDGGRSKGGACGGVGVMGVAVRGGACGGVGVMGVAVGGFVS